MLYVGMDVHVKFTEFCLLDPAAPKEQRFRRFQRPTTQAGIEAGLRPLGGDCVATFEVGTQAQWLAGIVRPLCQELKVANSSEIPWLFRDGKKNDRIDARKLATLLYLGELPTVHLPTLEYSSWRSLINYRRRMVSRRSMVKNQIHGILRSFGMRCPHKSVWSRLGTAWLSEQKFDAERDLMVQLLREELKQLDDSLLSVEKRLDEIAVRQPAVKLLRTIPGVGPRTAEAIVAFTEQINRFKDRRKFTSYFGMTPKLDASGERVRHGHISKRGPSVVRWVLNQAAHCVVRRRGSALAQWFDRVHRGRKNRYKKAIVALGRKVLAVAFGMLRQNAPYDDGRVSGIAA